jgi:hypothetical protein
MEENVTISVQWRTLSLSQQDNLIGSLSQHRNDSASSAPVPLDIQSPALLSCEQATRPSPDSTGQLFSRDQSQTCLVSTSLNLKKVFSQPHCIVQFSTGSGSHMGQNRWYQYSYVYFVHYLIYLPCGSYLNSTTNRTKTFPTKLQFLFSSILPHDKTSDVNTSNVFSSTHMATLLLIFQSTSSLTVKMGEDDGTTRLPRRNPGFLLSHHQDIRRRGVGVKGRSAIRSRRA